MQHFVIESTYLAPQERVQQTAPAHRVYLQTAIDQGLILCAGPKEPWGGGLIIARADSQATLEAFFASDPYVREGLAEYRYTQFKPLRYAPEVADWAGAA